MTPFWLLPLVTLSLCKQRRALRDLRTQRRGNTTTRGMLSANRGIMPAMERHGVQIPQQQISEFCRRNAIQRLSLFGSFLREDFRPDSDIDVLVEFSPGRTPGLLQMAGMELELTRVLGRKVDLRTPAELSRYFRDQVLRTCEVQYAA